LTLKFKNKQDYAEETEGSNLNNTECEYSSESDCSINNKKSNKELKPPIKPILVKRKRLLSPESENDKPPKKSQKTIYMESFDLAPSGVTSETILNEIQEETTVVTEKVPGQMTTINNGNNMIINKVYSIPLTKDAVSKNTHLIMSNGETCDLNKKASNEITLIDVDDTTNKKNKIYSKEVSEKVNECSNNTDETVRNNNLVTEGSLDNTDTDGTLVIDEDIKVEDKNYRTVTKEPQENKITEVESEVNAMNHCTIDSENCDPIITEPEVIIHEDKDLRKDVIEINDLDDDSDVEITSCETSIVPVQNKKSLETIIKASTC